MGGPERRAGLNAASGARRAAHMHSHGASWRRGARGRAAKVPAPRRLQLLLLVQDLDQREAASPQARVGNALPKLNQAAARVAVRQRAAHPRVAGDAAEHGEHNCMGR